MTGDTAPDPALADQLAAARAHIDACRAALDRTAGAARDRVAEGAGVLSGRHAGDPSEEGVSGDGASAEALGRQLRGWAKELSEAPEGPPFFGRLDFVPGQEAGEHRGLHYYIGRRRIAEHPSAPPLVLDWRAPVSRAFYQATARDPHGVAVRRRFGWAPGSTGRADDLTGLEDEQLARAGELTPPGHTGQAERAARTGRIVRGEIERPRVGPMRDIVATIQPDQDDLVRAGPDDSVCVQGAPGTGKTAVGLHRAAYLLYTWPRRIERGGLLVLGPNSAFLRYISEVLPALGEVGIRQCRVDDLLPERDVRAEDGPAAAALKHSARMATVLERALYARVRLPDASLAVPDGSSRRRLPEDELRRLVEETRAQPLPYEAGRERVRARTVALLRDRVERRAGPPGAAWERRMGRSKAVRDFLDVVWPRATPEEVVAGLLGSREALAAAGEGLLSAEEQGALLWSGRPRSPRSARWSAADLLLLDEVAGLIRRPEESYAHIVVDEAQDLSPLQCRAVARRSRFGSLTVLGDLAQGTTPWAADDWSRQLARLGAPGARVVPLTTGFRVPAAVVEAANRVLGSLNVPVPAARSLRRDGSLRAIAVSDPSGLDGAVTAAIRSALAGEGSIGVIADGARAAGLRAALQAAGITPTAPEAGRFTERVTLLPADVAKGLEYDHVVLAEPAEIADGPRGLHLLYVALTRAVSRLEIVHAAALPPAMG